MARRDKQAKLMLLDTAEAALPMRPAAQAIWSQRHSAARYRFDLEASTRVGEMMRDCTDLMVDNIEFARSPYPTAYFEFDSIAMWRAWRPEQGLLATRDAKVGFLIHHGSVLVIASGQRPDTYKDNTVPDDMVCGMTFRINRPQSVPFTKLTGHNEVLADTIKQAYVFGGQRGGNAEQIRRLRARGHHHVDDETWIHLPPLPGAWTHSQVAAHFDCMPAFEWGGEKEFTAMCFLGGGDPMTLTTMLLLLNQPSKFVSLTEVKREAGMLGNKRFSFREHHIVTLHLERQQHVRDIFHTTDRSPPIAHPVQGHWKHYNKSSTCNHHHPDERQAWEPVGPERTIDGDYKRYWCPICLQRRTWTENFTTGGGGFATNEHEVTV